MIYCKMNYNVLYFERISDMYKRLIALIAALIMCFCVTGCSNGDVPDGMLAASIEGEPFKLYVPKGWTVNTVSGISGAFYAGTDNIAVSARYFPADGASVEDYVTSCIYSYSIANEDFLLDGEMTATVLGGADATEIKFTSEYDGKSFTFRQLFTKHDGDIILLSFRCPTDEFDTYNPHFNDMIDVFALCSKGEVINDCVTDNKTPEGMKIASGDALEYRLYVPTSWITDTQNGASLAYVDESGRPNVTVTSYIPDDSMSVKQYFEKCEREYKDSISGYEFIGEAEREVGGRSATSYTYSATYDNIEIKIMQTVLVYGGRLYSVTYTCTADTFENHMEDVESILDSFRFR